MRTYGIIKHLLPRSEAWKTAVSRSTTKLLDGIGAALDDAIDYYDQIFWDQFPLTTRFVKEQERELGLPPGVNDAASRANISAAQRATGGQSPRYIQDILQAAGFDVYLHEPWATTNPYAARDPRVYTNVQYYGTVQCATAAAGQDFFTERFDQVTLGRLEQPLFNGISLGTNYLDNDTLQQRAIPSVPEDPAYWPFFLYVSSANFPVPAVVDPARRSELLRLILQLRPLHMWIVFLFTDAESTEDYFLFEEGEGFEDSIWF